MPNESTHRCYVVTTVDDHVGISVRALEPTITLNCVCTHISGDARREGPCPVFTGSPSSDPVSSAGQIALHSAVKGKVVAVYDIAEDVIQRCRAAYEEYFAICRPDHGVPQGVSLISPQEHADVRRRETPQ